MPKRPLLLQILLLMLAVATAAQSSGDSLDRALIARARKMYYSLQNEGVRELRCWARPDWAGVLASMSAASGDAKERALPSLSTTEFRVVITESRTNVTVDQSGKHPSGELPSDLAAVVEFVRRDIEQTFDMWRMITFKPLLPGPKAAYRLEHRAGKYDLIDGEQHLELDEKGVIQAVSGSIPDESLNIVMPLHYDQGTHGLVLSSMDLRIANESSPRMEMTVQYLEQNGLQLPSAIACKSEHPSGNVSTQVKINRYEIVRR